MPLKGLELVYYSEKFLLGLVGEHTETFIVKHFWKMFPIEYISL